MKLTKTFCLILAGLLWVLGLYLCITGSFRAGIPPIIAAMLIMSASRKTPHKSEKSYVKKGLWYVVRNYTVILLCLASLAGILYRNGSTPAEWLKNAFVKEESASASSNPAVDHGSSTESIQLSEETQKDPTPNTANGIGDSGTEAKLSLPHIPWKEYWDRYEDFTESYAKQQKQALEGLSDTELSSLLPVQPETGNEAAENDTGVSGLEIHFLDVGQGDCTLVMCGNEAMLIDAAPDNNGTKIQSYLTKRGIHKLRYLILTHPDADHIGSADVVISKFQIDQVFMPDYEKDTYTYRDTIKALDNQGHKPCMPQPGSRFPLGDASFIVLAPITPAEDPNNNSIVIKLTYGERSFLFSGDAEEPEETSILASECDLSADVLKVGHHGSKTSTSQDYLSAIDPTYAVISCGAGNEYHHPHGSTLNELREAGIQLFRTDEQGTITITCDGETITFNCAPSETWQSGS